MVRHVWWWPYSLEIFHRESVGALLLVELQQGRVGYSTLHPWPDLGDPPLEVLKSKVIECRGRSFGGRAGEFVSASLDVAKMDARARQFNEPIGYGKPRPLSHQLLRLDSKTSVGVERAESEGYRRVKFKMGEDLVAESEVLWGAAQASSAQMKFRLDFNGRSSKKIFLSWWQSWGPHLKGHLDVIEDPFPGKEWTAEDAGQIDKKLAELIFWDRERPMDFGLPFLSINKVYKPEIELVDQVNRSGRWFVTSNLAHPFGHSVALAMATKWGCEEVCGLQGLQHQAPSLWTERFRYFGPATVFEGGAGFGFQDLLDPLPWKRLF